MEASYHLGGGRLALGSSSDIDIGRHVRFSCAERPLVPAEDARRAQDVVSGLFSGGRAGAGWVRYAADMPAVLLRQIEQTAQSLRETVQHLILVGIGGSSLGVRAVSEALGPRDGAPKLHFAGPSYSPERWEPILRAVREDTAALCVVSKSGTTKETMAAFSLLCNVVQECQGEAVRQHILVVSGEEENPLRTMAREQGYALFDIPHEIGGRFSVFTPVGLLPLAVAGHDIEQFLAGAARLSRETFWEEETLLYALSRYRLLQEGKSIEVFACPEASWHGLAEWLKQLFGESEGKEGKGIFPASLELPADLHALGHYLTGGQPICFETLLYAEDRTAIDRTHAGTARLQEMKAEMLAQVSRDHRAAGVPLHALALRDMGEEALGELCYFAMMTTAVTGGLMGIDPFA